VYEEQNEVPQGGDEALQADSHRQSEKKQSIQEPYSYKEEREAEKGAAQGNLA
jgi:hypothetical protein